jgi:uncharacterized protein (TIGR03435 family)
MGMGRTQSEFNDGPSFFTEIEKQLGLKRVKMKGVPVDVAVIDHVGKIPTENGCPPSGLLSGDFE